MAWRRLLLVVLPGFHPGEGGRWYDRRFWPTVGNTLVFVGLAVPGVTISALLLAAALNRETRAMAALRTLFFLSQVLSVTVVTLIWQIMFSPRQGLIANITETFGGIADHLADGRAIRHGGHRDRDDLVVARASR